MLRFHSKFLPSPFTFSLVSTFSRISKKNLVPRILKDPKFTRTGISAKKKKSLQYDLSKPHIVNSHLYYNEKDDKLQKRREYKERKSLRNEYPPITKETPSEHLLNNLNDDFLLARGSGRILNVVLELETRDQSLIVQYRDLIQRALVKISEKAFYFNLREFGMLVTLATRYIPDNKEIWRNFSLNFQRILEKKKYYKENVLETKSKEKNFIFIFNNIYKASLRHGLDFVKIRSNMVELFLSKLDDLSNFSHVVLLVTTLTKYSKQEGKDFLLKLLPNVKAKMGQINEKDALGLIQAMVKCEVIDIEILTKLENKVLKFIQDEKNPTDDHFHYFSVLCQSISRIRSYKSALFPDFATKFFQQHKTRFTSVQDLVFLTDSFTRMKIHVRDIYKYVEKQINEKISGLPLQVCDLFLLSAQRRYENFSMVFLSFLAARIDKLFQNNNNLVNLKANKAIQIVNLMNVVKEKDRTVKFEMYDNFIGLIEAENLKEKNEEKKEEKKVGK